ncbi:hypothetical protein PS880_02491 [Pseudomonas fluorescens]|uniref:Uncharacterized protein n=1 Tax=Pseudomonas fluorescens TaxID=294 RepID=A0A5E7K165_PSEFL|nr:hypothetical protein PS880_02491 [Pseudomonas fluorescens]
MLQAHSHRGLSSFQTAVHIPRTKLNAPRTYLVSCSFQRPPPRGKCLDKYCLWTVILLKEHT